MCQKSTNNDNFTLVNFDFDKLPYLSQPWRRLGLHAVSLGFIKLPPDEGYTFTHSHVRQEEVYIVIEGKGQMLLNGELIEIERGDVIRVSPTTKRALKANSETSLFVICTGGAAEGYPQNPNSRYLIDDGIPDYDDIPPWCHNSPEAITRNARLKARMLKSKKAQEKKSDSEKSS